MKYLIDLDASLCCACGACAVACMDQNDIDLKAGESPFRITFDLESDNRKLAYISMACMHCEDAPCVNACPVGCLRKDESSGFTLYDTTNCIGCHSCALACPFGAPSFAAGGKMQKCDGCFTRIQCGMEPACVRHCPTGALRLIREDDLKEVRMDRSLKKLAASIMHDGSEETGRS